MGKLNNIKFRLSVIPVILILTVVIIAAVASNTMISKEVQSLFEEKGRDIIEQNIYRIEQNELAINTVEGVVEDKIANIGGFILNEGSFSNESLINTAKLFEVAEINIYNSQSEIVYTNLVEDNLGWVSGPDHLSQIVRNDNQDLYFEDIRQSLTDMKYYKYGYVYSGEEYLIQVGVLADEIQGMVDAFDYQHIMEDIAKNEDIVYSLFVDSNFAAIADSDIDDIGIVYDDDPSYQNAMTNKVGLAEDWYDEDRGFTIFEVIEPVVIDGQMKGLMIVGIDSRKIDLMINNNLMMNGIIVLVVIVIAFIMYRQSSKIVNSIKMIQDNLLNMSQGIFTKDLDQKITARSDEIGEMGRAVETLRESLKISFFEMQKTAEELEESAQILEKISEQSALATTEVTKTIEDIATGATDQARNTENGAISMNELAEIIEEEKSLIQTLNDEADYVESFKKEGFETLEFVVQKTEESNQASKIIAETISETNNNAKQIQQASIMIKNIADQTNLLALNAAIEAARAGEQGKGFAVVADEIRKLAEQSNNFAEEIDKVIVNLADRTSGAVETMSKVGGIVEAQTEGIMTTRENFVKIEDAIAKMREVLGSVNTSILNVNLKKDELLDIIQNVSAVSEENAAGTQQISASMEELSASVEEVADSSHKLYNNTNKLKLEAEKYDI